ncbi:EAL domain-containing protein [Oleispirillum naphthae]|uniref:EAL domain-containing protein n=1 Tax=Oleispirillum naphthae TaxID=2838853 RepID=UPI00308256E7
MNTSVATPALPETSLGGVRRILLVEDDLLHARLAQVFLTEGEGAMATVDVAATLTEALACIGENRYDAILLDLGLPDGRGLDLLRIILSEVPEVPVLVLTAESDEAQATEAVRMGAQDFLIKGRLDRRQLRRAVAYALARKQVLRTGLAEGLLQSVLNGSHNAMLALIPFGLDGQPRWRVALANPPCEEIFGRPPRDLEGAWLDEIALARPLPGIFELLEEALRTGAVRQHQLRLDGGDGAARWLLMDAVACAGGVSLTLTDITAIKAREDELMLAQGRAQKALDDRVSLLHALGQKVPATLERIMQRLDGSAAALADRRDAAAAETGLTAARAEAAALFSEVEALVNQRQSAGFAYLGADYLSVLEMSPDLSAVVGAADGKLLFLNGVGRQMLGFAPAADLSGMSLFDFVPPDYAVLFEDGMAALRGEASRVPMHLGTTDGRLIDVELLAMDCPADGVKEWTGKDPVLISATDTTRRNRASRRIIAREEQLRKIMDNVADAIVVVNEEGLIETVNRATEKAFGVSARDLVGTGVGRLLGPAEAGRPQGGLDVFLSGGYPARITGWRHHQGRRADGGLFPIEIAVRDLNLGERHLFIGLIRDISERVSYEENILYMANHDLLTTLANRTNFHEELARVLDAAVARGRRLGLMFFDLDRFKAINDTFGHLVGDRILSVFAKRLIKALDARARLVARLSADEFVALIEDSGGTAELLPLAARIIEAVERPVIVDNHDIRISCGIGVAEFPDAGPSPEDLMRGAEFAVRTAKSQGRGSVQVYDEALSASLVYRQRLETALATALDGEEFQVYYQPKVDLQSGALIGAEALIRWFHPELGLISPVEFIPIAEETGQIRDIGRWVLQQVCRDQSEWLARGVPVVPVAVNISAVQFRDANLDSVLRGILEEFGLPPGLLELELTESALVEDIDQTVETLSRLKRLGLSIAIDDFGSGYSSFGYLTRFPIDSLKIDRAFVCNIPVSTNDMTVARAIIGMAKNLDLKLVAEGVETVEQARFLKDHGCDMAQGYLYSRPVPAPAFLRLVQEGVPRLV